MPFDPDAYLASKQQQESPSGGFDPDAYLASKSDSKPYFPKFSFDEFKTKVDQQTSPEGMNHLAGAFFGPEALSSGVGLVAKLAKAIPQAAKPVIEYGLERIGVPVGLIKKMGGGLLKEGGEEASGLVGPARDVVPDAAADAYRSALQPKGSVASGEAEVPVPPPTKPRIDPFRVRKNKYDK